MAFTTIIMIYERSNNFSASMAVRWVGESKLKFIRRKLNSKEYIEMIDEQINTYATRIAGSKYIFQRDNAIVLVRNDHS